MPPRCRAQAFDKAQRQLGEHADVEIDHRELPLAVEARGGAEKVQRPALLTRELRRGDHARAIRFSISGSGIDLAEIDGDDVAAARGHAPRSRAAERVELRRAARDQDERMAVVGEQHWQRGRADAGGGAGDQGNGA